MFFEKYKIKNVSEINIDNYSKKENWSFINYLDTKNITNNKIIEIKFLNPLTDKIPSRAKRKIKENDIIISTVRPNQKHYGIIEDKPTNLLVSTGFTTLRAKENYVLSKYLYYLITQDKVTKKLQTIAEQSTTSYPSIKTSDIENINIELPSIKIQKQIISIINSIEKQVIKLRKINQNLAEILQLIFKTWFLNFEPFKDNSFKNTELGLIPYKWNVGKLKDILILIKKSINAKNCNSLPYLPIDIIPMNSLGLTEFKSNDEAKSSLITFDKNDILMGAMRVYFHRVSIAPCPGITRNTCFVLRPKKDFYLSYCLLLCNENRTIQYAQNTSKGSTMPYAVWDKGLGDMPIVIPPEEILKQFYDLTLPIITKIRDSYQEIQNLTKIRDVLLPKLMSGEIDVSDIKV